MFFFYDYFFVLLLGSVGVIFEHHGDTTANTLCIREVKELIGGMGVGSRPEDTSDDELGLGEQVAKILHEWDRTTHGENSWGSGSVTKDGA